jgi:hypothetical protein
MSRPSPTKKLTASDEGSCICGATGTGINMRKVGTAPSSSKSSIQHRAHAKSSATQSGSTISPWPTESCLVLYRGTRNSSDIHSSSTCLALHFTRISSRYSLELYQLLGTNYDVRDRNQHLVGFSALCTRRRVRNVVVT